MKLLDFINNKTNNAYKDFKLVSVIFDSNENNCTFKFLYKDTISDDTKDTLQKLISEYLAEPVDVIVKCKKAYVDEDLVKTILVNYLSKNYTSISDNVSKENIGVEIDSTITATIFCNNFTYNYLKSIEVKSDIISYLQGFFFESISLELEKNDVSDSKLDSDIPVIDASMFDDDMVETHKLKYGKVENVVNLIGEVKGNPLQISSISSSLEVAEIAGELMFLNERSFETKRKDEDGNPIRKTYYSFTLKDNTGRMNCVFFPTKADIVRVSSLLVEGKILIVHGAVEDFNGRLNFKVKHFGSCDLVKEDIVEVEETIEYKTEPNANYIFVKPEQYIELTQDNFFAEKVDIGQYLLDNDVVVFDIETTGLDALNCEIIEIGAVKLKGGKIAETFETLIKPKSRIPDEIINLTGINDDMVKDSPTIRQVLPDFYKFCYGTTIMAYNIDFDYKFINIAGMKQGYKFDMRQIDAMYLARAFVPGLKNFKLGTVCKKLGVSLENAHRAVHDATATAEVVIKLSPNIT